MENFINVLFENRNEKLSSEEIDEELTAWESRLEQSKKDLSDLIISKLEEEYQQRYDYLVMDIEEIIRNISEYKNKLYYKTGLIDGYNMEKTLNK